MFAALLTAVAIAVPGFTENAKLDARASYIAGKTVHVFCASTYSAWTAYVATLPKPPPNGEASGYTPIIGGTETYLSPETCAPLLSRIKGHLPFPLRFGGALDTLAHEGYHLSGIADEALTECTAYRSLPHYLIGAWGFRRGGPAYMQALAGAKLLHKQLPPPYQDDC